MSIFHGLAPPQTPTLQKLVKEANFPWEEIAISGRWYGFVGGLVRSLSVVTLRRALWSLGNFHFIKGLTRHLNLKLAVTHIFTWPKIKPPFENEWILKIKCDMDYKECSFKMQSSPNADNHHSLLKGAESRRGIWPHFFHSMISISYEM